VFVLSLALSALTTAGLERVPVLSRILLGKQGDSGTPRAL